MNWGLTRWLILALYLAPFYFILPSWLMFGFFLVGAALGVGLLFLDEFKLSSWYNQPEPENVPISHQLITRSPLFLVVAIPLSLFVITSTGSPIGLGLVLAMGLWLVLEMWQLRATPELFQARFGGHLAKPLNANEVSTIVGAATGVFIFLTAIAWL